LLNGAVHAYGESTDFDLVTSDGRRLPPKAVFGLAATEALGFPVLPKHFTGGINTPSFRALEAAGFAIVPKGAAENGSSASVRLPENSRGFSTKVGFRNPNGQVVLGPTGRPGTDHGQGVYVLQCEHCSHEYGANGSDIAARRCPSCGGGRPGFDVSAGDVIEISSKAPKGVRNPPWTRDELILALDLYMDHPTPDQTRPEVIELSALLNRLWAGSAAGDADTLRNPSGVSMKLSNFQRFDPRFQHRGRKGLAHGAKADEEVWAEFAGDRPRLRTTAAAIRRALEEGGLLVAYDLSSDVEASEGALLTRLHHYRERNALLVRKRKAQALAQHGRLFCEACDFDFARTYGERGEGYIEVHHTNALETLEPGARTKLSELAILCANCHRMVHAKRPWLTMDELKALARTGI
jgi:5-methylcytosine-specific restriction protein A